MSQFWKITWISILVGLLLGFFLDYVIPGWPKDLPMIGNIFIEPSIIERNAP